jgi:hypothetical protein
MLKIPAALAALIFCLIPLVQISQAQTGFRPPSGPPQFAYEELYYRDASNNIEYICWAQPLQSLYTIFHVTGASSSAPFSGTAANLTSIADSTNTATVTTSAAHGLRVGQRITVAGATIDTDLNGTYTILTTASTTTFTFTSASVSDATYTEATLYVTTNYTRDSQRVWSIQKFYYTTTYLDRVAWAHPATGSLTAGGPTTGFANACSARTTYF